MPVDGKEFDDASVLFYDVYINNARQGIIAEPFVELTEETGERRYGAFHKQLMGRRLLGIGVKVSFTLMEATKANLGKAFPWWIGSGDIPLMPTALGGDKYDYALPVRVHPLHMGADTTLDWVLLKGVPVGGVKLAGDGEKEVGIPLTYEFYPDRAQLPDLVLGEIGYTA